MSVTALPQADDLFANLGDGTRGKYPRNASSRSLGVKEMETFWLVLNLPLLGEIFGFFPTPPLFSGDRLSLEPFIISQLPSPMMATSLLDDRR